MPSLMFDPETWRNAAPIGGGAYQGGGGGLVQPTGTGGGIYQDYKAKLNKPVK